MSPLLAVAMSAMSSFTRRDELTVPSWPLLSTTTGTASVHAGRQPADAGDDSPRWIPAVPMRIVLRLRRGHRMADVDVVAAGRVLPGFVSDGDVVVAGRIADERIAAARGVAGAGRGGAEREVPAGGVVTAGSVVGERPGAHAGIAPAGRVVGERGYAAGGIATAGRVRVERPAAVGDVGGAGRVVVQRLRAAGGVRRASRVGVERLCPGGRVGERRGRRWRRPLSSASSRPET